MKAIIMSHENGGSYVLDDTGSFQFVKGYTSKPIGYEIDLTKQAGIRSNVNFTRLTALAAGIALIVVFSGFGWMWTSENHTIYVDINPSVELRFNRFNRLIGSWPLDDDGEELLRGLNLGGAPATVVVNILLRAREMGYPLVSGETPMVLVTFATGEAYASDEHENAVASAINEHGLADLMIIKACGTNYRYMAREHGISPGRMRLMYRLLARGYDSSIDELQEMALSDLIEAIYY